MESLALFLGYLVEDLFGAFFLPQKEMKASVNIKIYRMKNFISACVFYIMFTLGDELVHNINFDRLNKLWFRCCVCWRRWPYLNSHLLFFQSAPPFISTKLYGKYRTPTPNSASFFVFLLCFFNAKKLQKDTWNLQGKEKLDSSWHNWILNY